MTNLYEGARVIYKGVGKYHNKAYNGKVGTIVDLTKYRDSASVRWDSNPGMTPVHFAVNLCLIETDVGDLEDDY